MKPLSIVIITTAVIALIASGVIVFAYREERKRNCIGVSDCRVVDGAPIL